MYLLNNWEESTLEGLFLGALSLILKKILEVLQLLRCRQRYKYVALKKFKFGNKKTASDAGPL